MNLSSDLHMLSQSHRILIRGCEVKTWIGVSQQERDRPTTLLFDLELDVDARRAALTDDIADAVNYAEVVEDLRSTLADQEHHLLEQLAEVVTARIFSRFKVSRVHLRVIKIGILEGVANVGIEVVRFRSADVPATQAPLLPSAESTDSSDLRFLGSCDRSLNPPFGGA